MFAPAAVADPELDFVNRISGPVARLDEVLAFYGDLGLRPWLEVTPGAELELPAGTELLGFQSVLYGLARTGAQRDPRVRETEDAAGTARLILEAFGVPRGPIAPHGGALAKASERCGGRLFAVDVEDRTGAAAILTTREEVGYLALAGTLPEFRGRGCQRALIDARIAAAAEAGCTLIVATAEFGSVSHRNLERAGLRVACTKPVLRLTPVAEPLREGTA